jgi:hypothetical protein
VDEYILHADVFFLKKSTRKSLLTAVYRFLRRISVPTEKTRPTSRFEACGGESFSVAGISKYDDEMQYQGTPLLARESAFDTLASHLGTGTASLTALTALFLSPQGRWTGDRRLVHAARGCGPRK